MASVFYQHYRRMTRRHLVAHLDNPKDWEQRFVVGMEEEGRLIHACLIGCCQAVGKVAGRPPRVCSNPTRPVTEEDDSLAGLTAAPAVMHLHLCWLLSSGHSSR